MRSQQNRRDFLKTSAALGAGYFVAGDACSARAEGANEKVNVAVVGVGGRGESNLNGVAAHARIVALCDVDSLRLGKAAERFPEAKTHADWRNMLEQPGIDAVLVSTPDHNHAVIAVSAMRAGKHLYCEKPLAHSLHWQRRGAAAQSSDADGQSASCHGAAARRGRNHSVGRAGAGERSRVLVDQDLLRRQEADGGCAGSTEFELGFMAGPRPRAGV